MKNLEALMVHVLSSEPLDILLDELEISLIGFDWVAEIILVDVLFVVSQEGSDGLDARRRLQILRGEQFVEVFFQGGS